MLLELRIENFAIIGHLDIRFGPGLVTFTGETGAGKSIILDAIMAVMGGRTETVLIRTGFDRALVEATFQLPESSRQGILDVLMSEDLVEDENYLTLSREIRREGRSVARINGHSVNVALLREIGSFLVDIHGQSEHLSLLNVNNHLGLLDRYAKSEALLETYRLTYRKLVHLRRELHRLKKSEEETSRQSELLNFQVAEIRSARLVSGEEKLLLVERDRLANAGSLAEFVQQSLALLEESTPETPSISEMFGQVVHSLNSLSKIDSSQNDLAVQADSIAENLSDLALSLRDYLDTIEFNPRRLEQVEDRLNLLHNILRKYGGSVAAVLEFENETAQRLDNLAHAGEKIAELEKAEKELLGLIGNQGFALSQYRKQAAATLCSQIEFQLNDLNMSGAQIRVKFGIQTSSSGVLMEDGKQVAFDETGIDQIEFLIAPNPGEGFKPLVKIASGGETSRLMLALKHVLARADFVPTLIFDEIDQGIGGRVGFVVGEKLWQLARQHQVFCVTHLPQLAAFGEQHFRVSKQVDDGRTITSVEELSGSKQQEELAQMIGGVSEANLQAARDTLDQARKRMALVTDSI